MGKTLLSLFLLAGSLFAADPFEGTWKLNAEKTHYGGGLPGPAPKELIVVVVVSDGQFKVALKGTDVNGSAISMKYTVPETGGSTKLLEGGPPEGSGITSALAKREADSYSLDSTTSLNGKVFETSHIDVSADGKSMKSVTKGTDPQGKKYENVEVFDKQ